MKALTGLPTQAYLQVCEEAKVPLADLLKLVQQLEKNESPAFVARYRPDVSAGLDEDAIRRVQTRLRSFLDLADRRITILTSLRQQNRLSGELRKQIEEAMDRRALEDLYLPFKPKRPGPADEALKNGLEGLARFLWTQEPPDADLQTEASKYLSGNGSGPKTSPEALEGARASPTGSSRRAAISPATAARPSRRFRARCPLQAPLRQRPPQHWRA